MAIIAADARERVESLIAICAELVGLAEAETARLSARQPPLEQAQQDHKARLANAYRMEMARIEQDPSLVLGAPPAALAQLKTAAARLREASRAHCAALEALKTVSEGLMQAMAEEASRQNTARAGYGATGVVTARAAPAVAVDRRA